MKIKEAEQFIISGDPSKCKKIDLDFNDYTTSWTP